MTDMDISLVYVNWNSEDQILESIRTVKEKSHNLTYEIIVVDNASAQGTAKLEACSDIILVKNDKNSGFGAGCNLGVRHSQGKYLFFFNPDTRMENDALAVLHHYLEQHKEVCAVGPKICDAEGNIHMGGARSFHSLVNEFLEHSALTFRYPKGRFTGRPYYSYWDHNSTRAVDSLHGSAMMFRRDVFEKLGGFDEDYFLYCEEVDLCHRAKKAGCLIYYVHDAVITHLEKYSSNQYFSDFDDLILQHLRSLHLYMLKHYGKGKALLWRGLIIVLYAIKALKNKKRSYLAYCRFGLRLV